MTLDEFLRTLETLIDDREINDDDPGEGNFGCEDCRKCNHCRFCIGCDSCTDCTYCEESLDCTSCTQSKRCVSCEKVSYCEDCRDCKGSRYLTLCVDCTDCVHCLACVGLEGAEFFVLNQKRTRKEYFALLRQVQELMQERMMAGWRPPAIGLAGEIDDPITAGRDAELSTAPWLEQLRPEPESLPPSRAAREPVRDDDFLDYGARVHEEDRGRERPGRPPVEPRWREVESEPARSRYDDPAPRHAREPRRSERADFASRPGDRADFASRPGDRADFDERRPPARGFTSRTPEEPERRRLEPWDREPRRRELDDYPEAKGQVGPRAPSRREVERYQDWDDRPITREFDWEDSRERTVARPRREQPPIDDEPLLHDDAPSEREQEPSSPWIDEEAQARRRAKRGSLRQAGRPKRKPDADPPRESTGSASYRTGNAPARGNEGTHTGTGLRLGRKPKR